MVAVGDGRVLPGVALNSLASSGRLYATPLLSVTSFRHMAPVVTRVSGLVTTVKLLTAAARLRHAVRKFYRRRQRRFAPAPLSR